MSDYRFNISLSVLNHLGRNLYRSFVTVLGESISNSWDADARNVYITINKDENSLVIRDDGIGMSESDFQNKFLKIGYSKRKNNVRETAGGRPFVGRKGIGKLALLSCAKKITVLTKRNDTEWTGGIIDNSDLDEAIKDDISSNEYHLGHPDFNRLQNLTVGMNEGTVIFFEGLNEGVRNRIEYLRKVVALYFRFSLLDSTFQIFLNNELITLDELNDLREDTQFLWKINSNNDPYLNILCNSEGLRQKKCLEAGSGSIYGFIASVEKPSMLKIKGSEEKVSIDLFVNGRLREKDVLKHIPTARIVESYLYGQIHYDDLDDEQDRFTSSREGIVSDDPKFVRFLKELEIILKGVIEDWDLWRTELKQEGDLENPRMTRKARKSKELFGVVADDFLPSRANSSSREKVAKWIDELAEDAEFNFSSYGECFVSENLLRKYIVDKSIGIPQDVQSKISSLRRRFSEDKNKANISFNVRENDLDLSYCAMDDLARLADVRRDRCNEACLLRDAAEYKPIRDAMAHTSRLTKVAKNRLSLTYENIKSRIIQLLNQV